MATPNIIAEEHHNWSVNATLLYDVLLSHRLEWPSLTVQCYPTNVFPNGFPATVPKPLDHYGEFEEEEEEEDESAILYQYVLLGTHTSEGEPNSLLLMRVTLPSMVKNTKEKECSEQMDYFGFPFGNEKVNKFRIVRQIPHAGEANKIRYCFQNYKKVATKSISGDVFLFTIDDNSSGGSTDADSTEESHEDLALVGHSKEGFGLSWNKHLSGHIASTGNDGLLCVWDVNDRSVNKKLSPFCSVSCHLPSANDVVWLEDSPNVLLTCGDDGYIKLWDLRDRNRSKHKRGVTTGSQPVNGLSVSPIDSNIIASGGDDKAVTLWDIRKFLLPVHTTEAHDSAVTSLSFSPFVSGLLLSSSSDRFIKLWDINKVGKEQSAEDEAIGPSELVFSHGGHTAAVSDISWCLSQKYQMLALSVSEDNVLQLWHPKLSLLQSDSSDSSGSVDSESDDDSDIE